MLAAGCGDLGHRDLDSDVGARRDPLPHDRKVFRVFELSLRDMLAGRKPTVEILYRCGLGSLAAAAEQADPMAIVRSRMTSFRRLDVAA